MIDVLFTHSYFLRFDPKEFKARMPYPPLGTITAAAFLRNQGYSVALHDTMLSDSEAELVPVLQRLRPRIVVIYDDSFNYLTKMCLSRMREAAFRMAAHARDHGSLVLVFSSDSADHIEEYLSHSVDYVLCGEAEETLADLLSIVLRGSPKEISEVRGIAYRGSSGTSILTHSRPPIRDLHKLPMAAWDLVDLGKYRRIWKGRHGYFSLNISTTRGCPFHCNWCAKPLYGQVYHSRSPEDVVAEMKFLKTFAQPDHLWVTDDIFGLRPGWITQFAEEVRREDAFIPFKCLSRADLLLKEETIRHLKAAGCHTVWVGAESGSQKILDAMEKGTTVRQIFQSSRLLRAEGIRVGFFLQFGYPGETREDIEQTLMMVKECAPDEIGVSVSYPLPGTAFYERVRGRLGEKKNWQTSADFDPLFPATYSKEYYRRLHKVVHKKFSIWRGLRTLSHVAASPMAFDRRALRSLASMVTSGLSLNADLRRLRALEHPQEHVYV